jgi:plasmid stabilization system protein ParE
VVNRVVVLPESEEDLRQACTWYEAQQRGLGGAFLECVDRSIAKIAQNPEMYPFVHENYRRALLRRFPYAVFYEYEEEEVIVYAIFHNAQNPEKWRGRLQ